jgi:hypothetical protein
MPTDQELEALRAEVLNTGAALEQANEAVHQARQGLENAVIALEQARLAYDGAIERIVMRYR